jgi:hypothetical protein
MAHQVIHPLSLTRQLIDVSSSALRSRSILVRLTTRCTMIDADTLALLNEHRETGTRVCPPFDLVE